MTPDGFLDKVQEDKAGGYCHTIKTYEYNNRVLLATKITINTDISPCKKKVPTPVKNDEPVKQKETKKGGCPLDDSQWYNGVLEMGGSPFDWSKVVPKMGISRAVICSCFASNSRGDIKFAHRNRKGFCSNTPATQG